jgi:hypothetical protein
MAEKRGRCDVQAAAVVADVADAVDLSRRDTRCAADLHFAGVILGDDNGWRKRGR